MSLSPFNVHLPTMAEKKKGLDGKACWDGYKLAGTKKKGGKTVDNCVPVKEGKSLAMFMLEAAIASAKDEKTREKKKKELMRLIKAVGSSKAMSDVGK